MKSNLFSKILLLALISTVLAACAGFQQSTPHALPPLRVEYTLWWGDFALIVAEEKGFFAEEGVEVEPVYYEIFADSFSDLAAGQIDAALIASGDAMSIDRHTPINIIGVEDDGGYMTIVARGEIKSIKELKGKTVGTLTGTQYELLLSEMLNSAGLTTTDISIQNINPEEIPGALAKNEIQAGFVWEPYGAQAIKDGAHILYPTDSSLRLFPDTIAFRQNVIEQRPEDIHQFMKAWFKAVDYVLNNPEETRQIAAKYTGVPVEQIQPDPNLKIFTLRDNIAMYAQSPTEANSIFNIVQKTADYLIASGTLAIMPDIESIITSDYLPQMK